MFHHSHTFQVSPSVKLELTFCSGTNEYWVTTIIMYQWLLLVILIYLSYKNSKISIKSHMEEGSAGTRMVGAISITTLAALFTFYFLQANLFEFYRAAHWLHVAYTVVAPPLYLLVIFGPKVYVRRHGECTVDLRSVGISSFAAVEESVGWLVQVSLTLFAFTPFKSLALPVNAKSVRLICTSQRPTDSF